ncbi:hypothetical protein Fmac_010429 [Flemingia macrophylla]|uniref:Uncharacterized protein n=1 Tax=Flemingia macrophylla TaxID=520843 RepID=A0ABD1MJJ9_9FABA
MLMFDCFESKLIDIEKVVIASKQANSNWYYFWWGVLLWTTNAVSVSNAVINLSVGM